MSIVNVQCHASECVQARDARSVIIIHNMHFYSMATLERDQVIATIRPFSARRIKSMRVEVRQARFERVTPVDLQRNVDDGAPFI